jgi:L-histidine Nalpha-methyltransferase
MPEVTRDISYTATDIIRGLKASPKYLPSRYFYDAKGDRLFQKIMELPEYYLTRAEFEIFKYQGRDIITSATDAMPVQLIELGAGDGVKTKLLIQNLLEQDIYFRYYPIDISPNTLGILANNIDRSFGSGIPIHPLVGDYFQALSSPVINPSAKKLVLFLGSTIGNFYPSDASNFIGKLKNYMVSGDKLLIGFDLKKDPATILAAYNDKQGITREFNLNLLARLNRELDADFDLAEFQHYPIYDPLEGAAKSYMVSKKEQVVYLAAVDEKISFKAYESVFTEISQKYDLAMIKDIARKNGLHIMRIFRDKRDQFADVLFEKL